MIIGISGKMGVGKTTFAKVGLAQFDAEIANFGGVLKQEIMDWLTEHKVLFHKSMFLGSIKEKAALITIPFSVVSTEMFEHDFLCAQEKSNSPQEIIVSGRSLMQWWGTQYRREQNPDYWPEKLMANIDESKLTVIDDVRFPNEAEMIRICGGVVIHIKRDMTYDKSHASHESEIALDDYQLFYMTINNNNITLEQYQWLCRSAVRLALSTVV